jgi:hypothetical protein
MVIGATNTFAYGTYSGCESCHPEFVGGVTNPEATLHAAHLARDNDCGNCHGAGDTWPVSLVDGTGCVGCHGRFDDAGFDPISEGLGAGVRQHHFNAGQAVCVICHSIDGDPGIYTPVGESNGSTPFYLLSELDPCADGLDNDGDLLDDGDDPDCGAAETYTISGAVTGPDCDEGVEIILSSDSFAMTETTDGGGAYSFPELTDGTYTVTASLDGYSFVPSTTPTVTLPPDKVVNFTCVEDICDPTVTCETEGAECGSVTDPICGTTEECAECADGFTCDEPTNTCEEDVCDPTVTCETEGAECGSVTDPICGTTEECAECADGFTCNEAAMICEEEDTPEIDCECDDDWKNHGAYVKCVAQAAGDLVDAGDISEDEKDEIVSEAGQSDCGKKQ